jgi:hypothetical protein
MTLRRQVSSPPATRIMRAREAEECCNATRNAQAAITVAGQAADAKDCGELLAMLGLDAALRTARRRY